jgi:hypothetical protein
VDHGYVLTAVRLLPLAALNAPVHELRGGGGLEVYHVAGKTVNGLLDCLAQSRVRMDIA